VTRFILVTFFFLAVAFYEMSGGSTFVPEQRVAAADSAPETVTRAETTTLDTLPEVAEATVAETLTVPLIEPQVAETPVAEEAVVDAVVEQVAAAGTADLRSVIAERVNVREGPGTDYAVMDKLVQGTETEVLEIDSDGWAHVRVIESGLLGWVSAEYLAASNG
jgi:uncharacterized protein YgiM (DUF1202 family)